jgi:DNA repair photolyase
MKNVKLIKPMYACQNVPVVVFDNDCSNPCLYCVLANRHFLEENIIANGFENVLESLKQYPGAYFSPTSDCFLPANAELTHELIKATWQSNSNFVPLVITKQIISDDTIKLFAENKDHLVLQISVPSLNESAISILEPGSAPISQRLELIQKLTSSGVKVIAVIMPWFNLDYDLEALPKKLAELGIKKAIVATGVLPKAQRQKMLATNNYWIKRAAEETELDPLGTKHGYVLPFVKRQEKLKDLTDVFTMYNIKAVICTADNHDLEDSNLPLCHKFQHRNLKN